MLGRKNLGESKEMEAEKNLKKLLENMDPIKGDDYAFCNMNEESLKNLDITPLCTFHEEEGITAIIRLEDAERLRLPFSYAGTKITLNVTSSLEAVGFLAKITEKLARAEISVNAFSPIHHDHIFVTPKDADNAMVLLLELSKDFK